MIPAKLLLLFLTAFQGTAFQGDAFPPASPAEVGVDAAALEQVAAEVAGYLERDLLVGAELLVIKDRRTVLHECFGSRDREAELPWTAGTLANVRSMTKPLTGAAVQILIDRGLLALDDPVAEYLPGFDTDAARGITVRQLLTHRAGLPLTILRGLKDHASLIDMGNAVGRRGPERPPDSRFWYSDSGTDALGALVEVVSGKRLDAFVREELLEPLGMRASLYDLDPQDPRRENIASLYVGGPGNWTRFWSPADGCFYPYAWGSQSLYSTPLDYARFLAMWMDGGRVGERVLLSPGAIERTLTPVSEMSMLGSEARFPTSFHGLEVYYGQMAVLHVPVGSARSGGSDPAGPAHIVGHSGSDGTIAWAWPERDLIVCLFTQSRGGGGVLRLEEALDRLLVQPEVYAAEEEIPVELRPYLGVYVADWANHMKEEFRVHARDGGLALDIPTEMDFRLAPTAAEGVWAFAIAPTVRVWFEQDATGAVNCLRIEQAPLVFEAPRKGTPHAEEVRERDRATEETVGQFLGGYEDPEADGLARVLIDGDYLAIEGADGSLFHLWKVPGDDVWTVRENPFASITFQKEQGIVVSFTRHSPGGARLLYPRVE